MGFETPIKDREKQERAVLVGLCCPMLEREENADNQSLDELEELLKTAGGVSAGRVLQNRAAPDPGTFIGEGKALEIRDFIKANDLNLVVFDNSLSPSQTRALEKLLECRVIDRSALILDIFAGRARTSEGKLQVELAQYQYLLPRLSGMWGHLVRQTASGGRSPIGTRGPGETQLETDRRHIRQRIARLKSDLEAVRSVRATQRRRRGKAAIPLVAIVGYTNAGKSTLLNALTGSSIEANDRLFDTLDPTTRTLLLPDNRQVLLSDTVGFISKLPHLLIDAFKATLEELSYADLILHVIDGSNPQFEEQAAVTEQLIHELCPEDVPRLRVFNKMDLCGDLRIPCESELVLISARTGEGLDTLVRRIGESLDTGKHQVVFLLPYEKGGALDMMYRDCDVKQVEYTNSGIEVNVCCTTEKLGKYKQYLKRTQETQDE